MSWQAILLTGAGGFVGSILRYLTGEILRKFWENPFPVGTMVVNVLGSLIIGIVAGWLAKSSMGDSWLKFMIITGFCGGFTTFSSFTFENLQLLKSGNYTTSAIYIFSSIILGLVAVFLGYSITAGK